MNVLLYRAAFDAHEATLRAAAPEAGWCVMEQDGSSITLVGTDDPGFDAAWGSVELYVGKDTPVMQFMQAVIGSDRCRWFQTASAGVEHPVFRRIVDSGKQLTNSPATAPAIAEFVLAHVLARYQPLQARRDAQQRHAWERFDFREIGRAHWLIVGFGHIGQAVAERARAFGARITGVRRSPGEHPLADALVHPDRLAEVLPEADIVVLALAATPGSEHLLDADLLAACKPGSVLVNIARGSVLDEDALPAALDAGRPGHAVLDVFATEPLAAESPLWDHPGVTISAHASASSDGTVARGVEVFTGNLGRFASGEPLQNRVPESYLAPPRD